ncbi:hypothetical protein SFB93_04455 [Kurthia gibsonii]|uniref:hypothetical protein n=1 Tax=Kurthia TaxID=1649 RepID=UPI000745D39D|nr:MULTISPECIES: hypothetical protein [Kurthia]AMA63233.1 hypothetical protein ASO14_1046 [Kurthia sp. 11kri321]MEB6112750.1 hypothetical protein [Kurthia gibsonii]
MAYEELLCPCQSGKKASMCCFVKKNNTLEKHWTAIKGRVVQTFLSEHPTAEELIALQQWVGIERLQCFKEQIDSATLQHLLTDLYFFTENRLEWGYHLIEQMKAIVQPKTHLILSSWQTPYYFVGRMKFFYEDYVIAEHIWTGECIYLADVDLEDQVEGNLILGHVVPGVNERFYGLLSSAIILEASQEILLDSWFHRFEQSKHEELEAFFKESLLDCLLDLITENPVLQPDEKGMNVEVLQLIVNLDMLFLDLDVKSDRLTCLFFNYLMEEQRIEHVRKKQALIAAVLDFGMRYDFVPRVITQKRLGTIFDVSPSTIARYSKKISMYFEQDFDVFMFDKIRQAIYFVGTDATMDEFKQWQMHKHLEKMIFTNDLDEKRMEKKLEHIPYKPIKKHEKAQKYAYEAFLEDGERKRYELARLALNYDPNNHDAQIILSEYETADERLAILQDYPITMLNRNRIYLLKTTLLYQQGRFEEALAILSDIPFNELRQHTILYYFYACLHFLIDQPKILEDLLQTAIEDTALFRWLTWVFMLAYQLDEEEYAMQAIQANPFVQKYIEMQMEPYSFPTHQFCAKGDPNEAKMIHFVIHPLLQKIQK